MRLVPRLVATAGASAALALSAASGALAATGSPVVGHLYVNGNTAGHNTVSGFDRHADGALSPIVGTPFDAGGAGFGAPTGSAGALARTGDGRYLLAVDAASDQISVLRIRPDGSLRLVEVDSSRGRTPVSLAVHGSLVYVANAGAGGSNYTGFRLNPGGHLAAIPGSTFSLPDTALPGQILFSGDGRHLVGTRVGPTAGPSFIDSFAVGADGRLTPAPGSPFAAQGVGPFGSAFRPTNPNQLFVSNAHDGAGNGTVSAYELAADGTLTIGAMTTYTEIIASSEARARPILGEVCAQIADVQVRNRGTIGGNVCTNDPTNHLPPLLAALGATFTIAGAGGERTVSSDEFFLGVYMTAVGEGELLTTVSVPASGHAKDGFAAVTIGADGTCIANAAAALDGEGGPRVALGCVDAVPVVLRPESADAGVLAAAVRDAALEPASDVHASADYRRHLAEVTAQRAVAEAARRRR